MELRCEDISKAVVKISWTISQEEQQKLVEMKIAKPYILLVAVQDKGEKKKEWRDLAPLEDGERYFYFHRPGTHTLYGIITWRSDGRAPTYYINKLDEDRFDHTLFRDGEEVLINRINDQIPTLEFDVPDNFFAWDPPTWLKKWVDWSYELRPLDGCQWRKRLLYAFCVQPFMALILFFLRMFIALFLASLGMRGINWKPLYHFLSEDTEDIWISVSWLNSIFLYKKNEWEWRNPLIWISIVSFMPLIILGEMAGWRYLMHFTWPQAGILALLTSSAITLVIVTVIIVGYIAISLIVMIGILLGKTWSTGKFLVKKATPRKRVMEAVNQPLPSLDSLVYPSSGALPGRRRSLRLLFDDLKAQVCRPLPD